MENETKFNIKQASDLSGASRQTIHRYIKNGKLTVERTADGKPIIDKSELLRVFPNLVTPGASQKSHGDTSQVTAILQSHIERLERQLDVTVQEREREREEYRKKEERLLAIIENQTRLLPASKEPEPKKTFWQRLFT